MVMIDSNYKFLDTSNFSLPIIDSKIYKKPYNSRLGSVIFKYDEEEDDEVDGDVFDENDEDDSIKDSILTNLRNIFDESKFSKAEFKQYGGIEPPKKILEVIENIKEGITELTIDNLDDKFNELFYKNFSNYLHNKIGKELKNNEIDNIDESALVEEPKIGKIYVNSLNKFVLYIGDKISIDNREQIGNISSLSDGSNLKEYKINSEIEQDYKLVDSKFTKYNLLDKYVLKK